MSTPIVQLNQFIQAIRDAGYRGTAAAVAELVDNSIEADAKTVNIQVLPHFDEIEEGPVIIVEDNGAGMTPKVLKTALQFGGSTRFGSRASSGRFGMGLPNSSVSQARRVEVYTWTKKDRIWWSYLDIDEVKNGILREVPTPKRKKRPVKVYDKRGESHGTIIFWTKCDRLSQKRLPTLIKKLRLELGRVFRTQLWSGRTIIINGKEVKPRDPLFLREGENLTGANLFGPDLVYPVAVPGEKQETESCVTVRFVELPVDKWFTLTNEEKRRYGITKKAGVSFLRAGREIDFGWFLMGNKRKENYDDWWRCEIEFQPSLDELFGVTHTKQNINPSERLRALLEPDLESIAHKLNARIRSRFLKLKEKGLTPAERRARECDMLFEPPPIVKLVAGTKEANSGQVRQFCPGRHTEVASEGLHYLFTRKDIDRREFFDIVVNRETLHVTLNCLHPFFVRFYSNLSNKNGHVYRTLRSQLELIILAAARAEVIASNPVEQEYLYRFRKNWSDLIAAFLI